MKESTQEKKYKQQIVDWNKTYPVGTPVIYINPIGERVETTTKSIAFLSDAGTPAISLNGTNRIRSLYCVKPIKIGQI